MFLGANVQHDNIAVTTPPNRAALEPTPMQLPFKAYTTLDDWTGKRDPKERRRIQNRLNQRAARQRRCPEKWTPLRGRIKDVAEGHQTIPSCTKPPPRSAAEQLTPQRDLRKENMQLIVRPFKAHEATHISASLELLFPLSADHLITLIQHNVYRGLLTNMLLLHLPNIFSCDVDIGPCALICPLPLPTLLPPSLHPTPLQQCTPHESWIDLFPLPALRDRLIQTYGSFDECELCVDILGALVEKNFDQKELKDCDNGYEPSEKGLIVWGDPWNITSWELTEGFVKKWGCLFEGCEEEILSSTNHWRGVRGEEPLRWATDSPGSAFAVNDIQRLQ